MNMLEKLKELENERIKSRKKYEEQEKETRHELGEKLDKLAKEKLQEEAKIKSEIENFAIKICNYSKFLIHEIMPVLAEISSVMEGKVILYESFPSEALDPNSIIALTDKETLKSIKKLQFKNKGIILLAEMNYLEACSYRGNSINFFTKSYTESEVLFNNNAKISDVNKEFITFVVNYKIDNNIKKLPLETLYSLKNTFLKEKLETIKSLYTSYNSQEQEKINENKTRRENTLKLLSE